MDMLHLPRQKRRVTSLFFSGLMRKKTEEINQQPPLYRTWIGPVPELNVLNPAHLEVRFLFHIKRLAKRTEFSTTRGMLFVSYQETGKKN
jgi:hypothetical protein